MMAYLNNYPPFQWIIFVTTIKNNIMFVGYLIYHVPKLIDFYNKEY